MSQATQTADALVTFCNGVIDRYKTQWPPSEGQLAEALLAFHSPGTLASIDEMRRLCQRLGVEFSIATLEDGLYGLNGAYGSRRSIVVSNRRGLPLSMEHSFLHELRELMEYVFRDLGYPAFIDNEKEERAEDFAIQVQIQVVYQMTAYFSGELQKVQTTWKRWLGSAFVFLFTVAGVFACATLPHMEEALREYRRR